MQKIYLPHWDKHIMKNAILNNFRFYYLTRIIAPTCYFENSKGIDKAHPNITQGTKSLTINRIYLRTLSLSSICQILTDLKFTKIDKPLIVSIMKL